MRKKRYDQCDGCAKEQNCSQYKNCQKWKENYLKRQRMINEYARRIAKLNCENANPCSNCYCQSNGRECDRKGCFAWRKYFISQWNKMREKYMKYIKD